mmetsp:Transcript_26668/g.36654  ORF Transcript_26668/g.36654 Transcript_26668/m.36654 type:complete len:648 (-) Transcript_26668:179-2122(-)|eukprot:CAMPEP_0185776576 /NCGR_PEP_ID=MMETSP1174-20130828/86224_1 /TAXON_ID=35687 /ORGANISM="Dictyocha speculum, Strain CCMP1381" /LENGTH=647 /DNA_ID=CAMNT_0028464591 /DNA_START=335 /DNA_END=2278 /DNA_ORIENTATION=+
MGGEFFFVAHPANTINQELWARALRVTKSYFKLTASDIFDAHFYEGQPFAFEYKDTVNTYAIGEPKSFRLAWQWGPDAIQSDLCGRSGSHNVVKEVCKFLSHMFNGQLALVLCEGHSNLIDEYGEPTNSFHTGLDGPQKLDYRGWPWVSSNSCVTPPRALATSASIAAFEATVESLQASADGDAESVHGPTRAPQQPGPPAQLLEGTRVKISGLKKAITLNGLSGVIVSMRDNDRVGVLLDNTPAPKSIPKGNVHIMHAHGTAVEDDAVASGGGSNHGDGSGGSNFGSGGGGGASVATTAATTTEAQCAAQVCAFCYAQSSDLKKCAKCPRLYCCKRCQIDDWKDGKHKKWCGQAGEIGVDFEIRPAGEGKGFGLFVKRDFKCGEKILIERPVLSISNTQNTATVKQDIMDSLQKLNPRVLGSVTKAVNALTPGDNQHSIVRKVMANCVAMGEASNQSAVYVHFSRVNHDCIGNSNHCYDDELNMQYLVANYDIPSGSEVTFSYGMNQSATARLSSLVDHRGFVCKCRACESPELTDKLDRIHELDASIMRLGGELKLDHAMRAGKALIKLYDELKLSPMWYARTYYEMFQIAIARRSTTTDAKRYIQKACEYGMLFHGFECASVNRYKQYAANPTSHRMSGLGDTY